MKTKLMFKSRIENERRGISFQGCRRQKGVENLSVLQSIYQSVENAVIQSNESNERFPVPLVPRVPDSRSGLQ